MGKCKDLREFDKGQIVMARRLDQSISKTAALVGCSRSAVVSIYQKCSKEGTVVNQRQGHGRPRLACVIQSNRRATVAQIAEEVNAGSDRKVSEYTVHDSVGSAALITPVLRKQNPAGAGPSLDATGAGTISV
ncbi:hypothetical protein QTP70_003533 [Hemibagrus guttatus]|uniref:Transposase n=1 Tax=Hemibagrus guttatus TaxID=175788 RepID=A0AAE0VE26_9TELE|nr:hypothetical protein QTP70_003533 [Hemibagrus guttatus]